MLGYFIGKMTAVAVYLWARVVKYEAQRSRSGDLSHYYMLWLAHYLWGSGKPLKMPSRVLHLGLPGAAAKRLLQQQGPVQVKFRDAGAWMVGTMTLQVRNGRIVGTDRYDWHPNAKGRWKTVPMPAGRLEWLMRIWRALPLIRDHIVEAPLFEELYDIRDSLWPCLKGREFDTLVDTSVTLILPRKEKRWQSKE
jgi:hypothetical protein